MINSLGVYTKVVSESSFFGSIKIQINILKSWGIGGYAF